jgi:hypothetical protein
MNERIKELWEQSTGAAVPEEGFYSSASKYNIEKFAELIVRECMKLCKEVEEDLELIPNKLEREASVAGVIFCYDAIRGEFGVEE